LSNNLILDGKQLDQRIKRISFEIYENNIDEKSIVLAGISENGFALAKLFQKQVDKISPLKSEVVKININKAAPFSNETKLTSSIDSITGKSIILIDDVLNTGKTAAFALKTLLDTNVKKIEFAVIVNRSHKLFPVYPKYRGYELATAISENVEVLLTKNKGVYLN
jgi:pyrimidine operon attenuation protein/uracil phosphoribosyltransferase